MVELDFFDLADKLIICYFSEFSTSVEHTELKDERN
jgi:hypothetical protein